MARRAYAGMSHRYFIVLALLAFATGCASQTDAPLNLTTHKQVLIQYRESGAYERQIAVMAEDASRWIETRASRRAPGERLAVILDIDETALSNWPIFRRDDFGYIAERWHAWLDRAEAEAIAPVRDLYRVARRADVAVIFLTGRLERDRAATERNLRAQGYDDYQQLIVWPDGGKWKNSAAFKTEVRRELVADGWVIIANIGDQVSDLTGGYAEKTYQLPNPFYLTE